MFSSKRNPIAIFVNRDELTGINAWCQKDLLSHWLNCAFLVFNGLTFEQRVVVYRKLVEQNC